MKRRWEKTWICPMWCFSTRTSGCSSLFFHVVDIRLFLKHVCVFVNRYSAHICVGNLRERGFYSVLQCVQLSALLSGVMFSDCCWKHNVSCSSLQSYLDKLQEDIGKTLEKVSSREKYINNQLEHLIQEYRSAQAKLSEVNTKTAYKQKIWITQTSSWSIEDFRNG